MVGYRCCGGLRLLDQKTARVINGRRYRPMLVELESGGGRRKKYDSYFPAVTGSRCNPERAGKYVTSRWLVGKIGRRYSWVGRCLGTRGKVEPTVSIMDAVERQVHTASRLASPVRHPHFPHHLRKRDGAVFIRQPVTYVALKLIRQPADKTWQVLSWNLPPPSIPLNRAGWSKKTHLPPEQTSHRLSVAQDRHHGQRLRVQHSIVHYDA